MAAMRVTNECLRFAQMWYLVQVYMNSKFTGEARKKYIFLKKFGKKKIFTFTGYVVF